MSRPSAAELAGLHVATKQEPSGKWSVTVTDDKGATVYQRTAYYKDQNNARQGVGRWVREHYDIPQPRRTPKPSPAPAGLRELTDAGNNQQLVRVLRRKAEANEQGAARYRAQADLLEVEAKRLTAAADVLEGPEHA